jgi:hypothetical protein
LLSHIRLPQNGGQAPQSVAHDTQLSPESQVMFPHMPPPPELLELALLELLALLALELLLLDAAALELELELEPELPEVEAPPEPAAALLLAMAADPFPELVDSPPAPPPPSTSNPDVPCAQAAPSAAHTARLPSPKLKRRSRFMAGFHVLLGARGRQSRSGCRLLFLRGYGLRATRRAPESRVLRWPPIRKPPPSMSRLRTGLE